MYVCWSVCPSVCHKFFSKFKKVFEMLKNFLKCSKTFWKAQTLFEMFKNFLIFSKAFLKIWKNFLIILKTFWNFQNLLKIIKNFLKFSKNYIFWSFPMPFNQVQNWQLSMRDLKHFVFIKYQTRVQINRKDILLQHWLILSQPNNNKTTITVVGLRQSVAHLCEPSHPWTQLDIKAKNQGHPGRVIIQNRPFRQGYMGTVFPYAIWEQI